MENGNFVSRGYAQIKFTDQYGEDRVIYRQKGAYRIKNRDDTIAHVLNRTAADMIGKRIREKRLSRGLTLDGLLAKAGLVAAPGLGKSRMYEIENAGKNRRGANAQGVRFGTLYALAMALECPITDLLPTTEEIARHAGVALVAPTDARVSKAPGEPVAYLKGAIHDAFESGEISITGRR